SVGICNPDVRVVRNDAVTVADIRALRPSHIILSPGSGAPTDAGICEEVIRAFQADCPILGVGLGYQAICEAFGGQIVRAETLVHGKASLIHIANGSPLFRGLPPMITAGRYHALAAKRESMPNDLLIIAEDESAEIMGVKHRDYPIFGLQFHPASILSEQGGKIIKNFLEVTSA
ncbi:MAG: aminodeoxychorismate/anthranilate synthase component II, partial [Clostridiales bacterium]|nr:aminodeoxychorismate/anthranilate synthase component II [Clostridiales bacterium]